EIQKRLDAALSSTDQEWTQVAADAFKKNLGNIGVCSFASSPRNVLMWSHYAAGHSGGCLQFERARDPATFLGALRVDYDGTYPSINWFSRDMADQIKLPLLQKHPDWEYEQESRIVAVDRADERLYFHPTGLTAIVFGCR